MAMILFILVVVLFWLATEIDIMLGFTKIGSYVIPAMYRATMAFLLGTALYYVIQFFRA